MFLFLLRDDADDVVEVLVGCFELVDDGVLLRGDVVDLSHEVAEHLQEVDEGQQLDSQRVQRRPDAELLLGSLDFAQSLEDHLVCFHHAFLVELHDADAAENGAQLRPHESGLEVRGAAGGVQVEVLCERVDEVHDVLLLGDAEEKIDQIVVVLDVFVHGY